MYKKHILAVVLAAAFCTSARAATLVQSTFDTNAEGWTIADLAAPPSGAAPTVVSPYSVTYSATGGNPGGYISEADPSVDVYYFQAPTKFLGDQNGALSGTFSFDLADGPATTFNSGESPLILVGSSESIYFPDITSVTPTFSTLSFTLAPGAGGTVNSQGGTAATLDDFATVLGNLQAVYVLGDYYNGGDTGELDNVVLASGVPEPTTAAMVGLSMAGAAWFYHRRRDRSASAA